jgi:transposase-like protein
MSRIMRSATVKAKILDEVSAEGAVLSRVCEQYGIATGLIYSWRANEKEIRKAARQEAREASNGHSNGASNGHTNGVHKEDAAEPGPQLQILGLTPLIRKLVKAELDKQLRSIVAEELQTVVASELKKAFVKS